MQKFFAYALLFTLAACNNEENKPAEKQSSTIKEDSFRYGTDNVNMNGYVVYKDSGDARRPAVLVVHEWWGLNDYSKNRARQLADLGYVAMAVDLYGDGKTASNPDDALKLAMPFYQNPEMARQRLEAAINKLKTYPQVDTARLAAIGYCFGGSMVLNVAKLGADLDGVVSFHGGLEGPAPDKSKLKAQILVCHGAADGFVPDKDSLTFRNQLDSIGAVYNFKSYPNAKHAFTNPEADENARKFKMDIAYNPEADKASWEDMKAFLARVFNQ